MENLTKLREGVRAAEAALRIMQYAALALPPNSGTALLTAIEKASRHLREAHSMIAFGFDFPMHQCAVPPHAFVVREDGERYCQGCGMKFQTNSAD